MQAYIIWVLSFQCRFLYEHEAKFHQCHQVMIDVKLHLAVLYGNLRSYSLPTLSHPQMERKLQSIRDVLDTLAKVETGYSSQKGKMLQEKLKVEFLKIQKDFQNKKISGQEFEKLFKLQKLEHEKLQLLHSEFSK